MNRFSSACGSMSTVNLQLLAAVPVNIGMLYIHSSRHNFHFVNTGNSGVENINHVLYINVSV